MSKDKNYLKKFVEPIIGQEAICGDGLGRVKEYERKDSPSRWVQVSTYFNNNESKWAHYNVELIDPRS